MLHGLVNINPSAIFVSFLTLFALLYHCMSTCQIGNHIIYHNITQSCNNFDWPKMKGSWKWNDRGYLSFCIWSWSDDMVSVRGKNLLGFIGPRMCVMQNLLFIESLRRFWVNPVQGPMVHQRFFLPNKDDLYNNYVDFLNFFLNFFF